MVRVTTLGDARVELGSTNLTPASGLHFSIALYLAIEAGKRLSRAEMRRMFWPEVPEVVARHSLRQLIYTIRYAGGQISCDRQYVSLAAQTVTLDYTELTADPTTDPALLLRHFLPGYDPGISLMHERWVQSLRDKGHAHLRHTLVKAIAQFRQLARWNDVEAAACRCLELDPMNEEATHSLAEALAMAGRKLAAIQLLNRYREDLGVEVAGVQLPTSILRHRISELLPPALPSARDVVFVGRTNLLFEFGGTLRQLRTSEGAYYHICGPRGIGKSRLVAEFARIAALEGMAIVRLTCLQHAALKPGTTLRQLAEALLQMSGAIGCTPASLDRMRSFVESHRLAAESNELEKPKLKLIADALVDLAEAVSHEQAILIVLEGASRIDRVSQEPFAHLCGAAHDLPIVVISTSGEAETLPYSLDDRAHLVELEGLSPADSAILFRSFAAGRTARINEEFVSRCLAIADGNPALLVELGSRWSIEGTLFRFPQSVISAVQDRFAPLSEQSRRLLQLCAVFASDCSIDRILRTNLYDQVDLLTAVDELGRLGLAKVENGSLLVADPLISSQLLLGTSEAGLRYLHHVAASCLEAELKIPQYDPLVWRCAGHHKRAGNSARGLELLTKCSDDFLQKSKVTEAIATLRRAIEFCATPEQSVLIGERLVYALRLAEQWKHVLQTAEANSKNWQNLPTHRGNHTEAELARLSARWHLGQPATSIVSDASRCLSNEASPPQHRTEAAVQLLVMAHNMGDQQRMHATYAVISDLRAHTGNNASTLTADLIYHSALGDLSTAETVGQQLVHLGRNGMIPAELALTLRQVAVPLRFIGRFDDARALLSEALEITTTLGVNYGCLKATDMIGTTFLEQGRLVEAWKWHRSSTRWIGGVGDPESSIYSTNLGAKVALLQHRISSSARLAQLRVSKILKHSVLRLRCDELALWIGLSLEKRMVRFDGAIIRAFEHTFAMLKTLGNQDFSAYVLANLRRTTSGASSAASLLDEYVNQDRRERSPLPEYLSELHQSLCKG